MYIDIYTVYKIGTAIPEPDGKRPFGSTILARLLSIPLKFWLVFRCEHSSSAAAVSSVAVGQLRSHQRETAQEKEAQKARRRKCYFCADDAFSACVSSPEIIEKLTRSDVVVFGKSNFICRGAENDVRRSLRQNITVY